MDDLFERGFRTKNGSIRTPQSIQSYATLATIIFQTNQNEQHGGQAIPAFDFFMAKGVAKSFRKHLASFINFYVAMENGTQADEKAIRTLIKEHLPSIKSTEAERETLRIALIALQIIIDKEHLTRIAEKAYQQTKKDTHQAMEGFIHNLNTMHSRGGNQVVFSSINYGTDTSAEGRLVIEELLKATIEGLGTRGEVPVFPIQIFKVKDGVSYSEKDFEKAMKAENIEDAMRGTYEAPNFDLLLRACQTTSKALFPNFMFLDTPFNKNEKWKADDPKRYIYELATMGCRTRVFENVAGEKSSLGRGNLSFTTLNMPRLAIEARIKAENLIEGERNKDAIEQKAKEIFMESVRNMATLVADQLYERYQYQRTALARQFPFMMGNDVWKGGGALNPNEQVGDALRSGTLGIGFIGGHNAMVALYGEGHGHSQKAWDTLYEAVMEMNKVVDEYKEKYNLNYSVLATPAEGLSGRFTKIDRRKYGKIPGVTDRDYYVNSFHVDVKEPISIPVDIHSHYTAGLASMSILKGIEAGADIIDTAMSPLSLGTSHMPTESLVAALQGTDYDTGLDLKQLNVVRAYFAKLREKYIANGQISPKSLGVDANTLLYQVPGGMFSNMLKQLKDAGKEDKLDEVLAEIPRVREDAGYPPLVTPTSQIVGTQAVFNVILGERYKMVTKEFKGLVHGDYGKTPAPISAEFTKKILGDEQPITCRFADTLAPEMDKLKAEAAKWATQEEDVLTYAMFPQVAPKFFEKRNAKAQGVDADHADFANKSHPV